MEDLLFLAQRCPYPPNKGDKITTWNILKHLGARYRIHLGTFIDDPVDWQHEAVLRDNFASVMLRPMGRSAGLTRAASGLLTGAALSVAYYRDAAMQRWVDDRLADGIRRVFVYSSAMARFVLNASGCQRAMHFADIDSDKWRQYAGASRWPMSWVYAREADTLLAWERRIAATFDRSFFISAAETADFHRMAPESAAKVGVLSNGVDGGYFAPRPDYPNPYPDAVPRVVFTGAMDYRPNIDAVAWFAQEVLPRLQRQFGPVHFCIVGSRPAAEVQALATDPHVQVTGRVDDVRPYVAHAGVVVAPLRIARGIQNKVLEGMAMAKTVVCTPQGLEGIDAEPGRSLLVAGDADEFAAVCARVLRGDVDLGQAARDCMLARYDWNAALSVLDTLFDGADPAAWPARAAAANPPALDHATPHGIGSRTT
ncbi:MAG: TIGR03087 family PEP-CTERM/XrtA system glycosyltransferase [Proteobacteria bacterium]|nr:TIGR03087 family PEP-CTERM/XrtA system glycosyltransferase [Pseudomonadota bacterium]